MLEFSTAVVTSCNSSLPPTCINTVHQSINLGDDIGRPRNSWHVNQSCQTRSMSADPARTLQEQAGRGPRAVPKGSGRKRRDLGFVTDQLCSHRQVPSTPRVFIKRPGPRDLRDPSSSHILQVLFGYVTAPSSGSLKEGRALRVSQFGKRGTTSSTEPRQARSRGTRLNGKVFGAEENHCFVNPSPGEVQK